MNGFRVTSAHALLVVLLGLVSTVGNAQTIAVPAQQRPAPQGLYKAAHMSKASTPLVRAYSEYRAHANRGLTTTFAPSDRFLPFSAGSVLVEARATADGGRLLNDLRQLGLTGGARHGEMVSGYIPIAAIEDAAALASLRSISAAIAPIRNTGLRTSQGDTALRAVMARNTYGVDGTGITVGVLSDSYDTLGGANTDVATGDLPAGVQVLSESTACGVLIFCIDEGRAMLQIVYDMAPGAALAFHTALQSKVDFANAIAALAAAGADVIVDDLLYLHEPMFQDGIVAQAVDAAVAGGAIYYSAAGNAGDESYESSFDGSGNILCIEFFLPLGDCHPLYERVGEMHDFDPGGGEDVVLTVTVPVNGVLTVAMQWDEPFNSPQTDHDVVLLSEDGGTYYDISANDNIVMFEGWEVLQFENSEFLYNGQTTYGLAITYDDVDSLGPPANLIKLVVFGSGNSLVEWRTDSSTIYGHANAAGAEAVGAAYWGDTPANGTSPAVLEPYSSKGGTPILFNSNGSPKAVPELRMKPEIVAVDGVDTTFFFNDPDGDSIDNFFGTSAAAPHAAGIAALLLEAQPGSTPAQVNAALESTALDMNTAGFDDESGHGLIQADLAIGALQPGAGNNPPTASFTTNIADLDVIFTDTSDDTDGSVVSWNWDFGDGNGSIAQHPTHTYANAGTYTVWLTVTDNEGDSNATNQAVTVSEPASNVPPVANFTFSTADLQVTFTDTSSDADGGVVSWSWDFGDGNGSISQHPIHTYAAGGDYMVGLTVTDTDGDTDSTTQQVNVSEPVGNAPPVANFTYSCNARECMFNASDSTDDDPGLTYSWDFGDAGSASGVTASHTYVSQGNYTVTLTVTDVDDASDSVSATFRVKNRGSTSGSTGGDSGDTTVEAEKGRKKCSDGIDNDGDTLIDGDDPDCR